MKTADDLLKEDWKEPTAPDPPVSLGIKILSVLEGKQLEIMTRANRPIIEGLLSCQVFSSRYDSDFIRGQYEMLMRIAVSEGGRGRSEIIDAIRAGGQMPDAFYQSASSADVPAYTVDDV